MKPSSDKTNGQRGRIDPDMKANPMRNAIATSMPPRCLAAAGPPRRSARPAGVGPAMLLAVAFPLVSCGTNGGGKVIIGPVEEVVFVPWNVKLPARVDTGAATSSLYVLDVQTHGDQIEFRFPDPWGNQRHRLPVTNWRKIKSSDGVEERRAVVTMEICLGGVRLQTPFSLDDRSRMHYPALIGRRTLEGRFVVDVSRPAPPAYVPEAAPR
jgi:hypothetical protein